MSFSYEELGHLSADSMRVVLEGTAEAFSQFPGKTFTGAEVSDALVKLSVEAPEKLVAQILTEIEKADGS